MNHINKRLNSIIARLFWVIFSAFAFLALSGIIHLWTQMTYSDEIIKLLSIVITIVVFAVAILISSIMQKNIKISTPITIFLLSLLIRLIVILVWGTDTIQVSDFEQAFTYALDFSNPSITRYYATFPNWFLYSKFISFFLNFYQNPVTIILLNAILSSLSAVLTYYICLINKISCKVSVLSALVYAFIPSHILYILLLTPEFFNIFFALIAVLLVSCIVNFELSAKTKIGCSILAGSFLALSGFFKQVAIIFVIALVILLVLKVIDMAREKQFKEHLKRMLFFLITIFLSFFIIQSGINHYISSALGTETNKHAFLHYVNIGLFSTNNGGWDPETSQEYFNILQENDYDYEAAADQMKQLLMDKIENNLQYKTPNLYIVKLKTVWSTVSYIDFVKLTLSDNPPGYGDTWIQKVFPVSQAYYTIMMAFFLVGALFALIKNEKGLVFFSALIILGFAILELIIESQARYKCVFYPYMSIIAAYGIYSLGQVVLNIKIAVSKNKEE